MLDLFIIFVLLSLVFIGFGYSFDGDILKLVGYTFLFILGMTLLPVVDDSGILYHDGDNVTVSGSTTVITPLYSSYTSHLLGFVTVILAVGGFALTFFERRGDDD